MNGKKRKKLARARIALTQPTVVYMFKYIFPGTSATPVSPSGVIAAWKAGPTIKPNTWASETIETASVRSFSLVADERYDLHNVTLAAMQNISRLMKDLPINQIDTKNVNIRCNIPEPTPTKKRENNIQ